MNNTQNQKQMGSKIAQSAAVRLESPFEGGVKEENFECGLLQQNDTET